jgi:hypothetical protein
MGGDSAETSDGDAHVPWWSAMASYISRGPCETGVLPGTGVDPHDFVWAEPEPDDACSDAAVWVSANGCIENEEVYVKSRHGGKNRHRRDRLRLVDITLSVPHDRCDNTFVPSERCRVAALPIPTVARPMPPRTRAREQMRGMAGRGHTQAWRSSRT